MNNFGVELLLNGFLEHSPPRPAAVIGGRREPGRSLLLRLRVQDSEQHGLRNIVIEMAFLRIVSGRFEA